MRELGLSPEDTGGKITFVGEDPIFPSVHRLGACIGIPIMAGAAGIADIWRQRSGRGQDLSLDLRKAIHGINPGTSSCPRSTATPPAPIFASATPMGFDLYRTKDGRLFLPTGAYPRLLERHVHVPGVLAGQGQHRQRRIPTGIARNSTRRPPKSGRRLRHRPPPEEWAAHPQGKHLADKPLVEIIKIGDSDPEPFTPAARPLSGLRVLAATHVIAGNVMARTLAEHGAEVLQIAHPEEFENEGLMQDPCAGFTSSAWLDLAQPEGLRRAYELAAGADVFVENYRGRKIADLGMSPEELAARRPGIIYASGKAFSHDGPWANRGRNGHGSTVRHWVHHRRRHPGTAEVPADQGDERLHRRLHRRRGHPGRADPPGQGGRQLPCAGQPGPLRDVVHVPGHLRQGRPGAHRRAAPTPGARHHHRSNPLRRTGPTGPTGAVLRNQALLARPGTGGARVKQACMDNQLRLRGSAG